MKFSNLSCVAFVLFLSLCCVFSALGGDLYDPDDTGLGEKFVVTSNNCVLYSDIGTSPTEVPPLTLLWRLEVPGSADGLKVKDGKSYCLVGNANGEEWGWLEWKKEWDEKPNPDCPVTKWNTRFLHKPIPPKNDICYEIFEDSEASKRLVTYKGKDVNTKIYAFITQEPGDKSNDTDTEVYTTKPVFFYPDTTSSKTTGNRNRPLQRTSIANESVDVSTMKMEIVFVIDTTRSMEPLIELAQETCQKLVNEIQTHPEYKDLVRFGLVEFRDDIIVKGSEDNAHIEKITIGGDEFISRVVQPLSDNHQEFLSKLNQLKCCPHPNGDEPEQVGCGLMTALEEIKWSNNSSKHIILLGDSPNKQKALNPDSNGMIDDKDYSGDNACAVPGISDLSKVSLDDIVTYARTTKDNETYNIKNFHALMYNKTSEIQADISQIFAKYGARDFDDLLDKIGKDSSLDKEQKIQLATYVGNGIFLLMDADEAGRQFERLAQNGEQYRGIFEQIKDKSGISSAVAVLLQKLKNGIITVQKARDAADKGITVDKVSKTEGKLEELEEAVWQFASDNQKPGSTNNKATYGFARAKDFNGNLVADPCVLILYEDMESLHDNLVSFKKRLEKYLSKGKGSLKMIFEDFRDELGETAAGNPIDDNTNIEQIIGSGFPVKTDVLSTTLQQLRGMSDEDFEEWKEKLDSAINTAEFLLGNANDWNQSWTPPKGKGKPQKYQYMKVSKLP